MQPITKMGEWERQVQERENAKPDPSRYTEEERALARELKEKRRLLEQRQNSAPLGERASLARLTQMTIYTK